MSEKDTIPWLPRDSDGAPAQQARQWDHADAATALSEGRDPWAPGPGLSRVAVEAWARYRELLAEEADRP